MALLSVTRIFSDDLAIDLGTANTLVYMRGLSQRTHLPSGLSRRGDEEKPNRCDRRLPSVLRRGTVSGQPRELTYGGAVPRPFLKTILLARDMAT